MFKVNQDYLKLPGSYLFSTVARKQREYQAAHPEAEIIKLSIGDVTQPGTCRDISWICTGSWI